MWRGQFRWVLVALMVQWFFLTVVSFSFFNETMGDVDTEDYASSTNSQPVQLIQEHNQVTVDNGISRVTLSIPDGLLVSISYGGIDNLLFEDRHGHSYWDSNWETPGNPSTNSESDDDQEKLLYDLDDDSFTRLSGTKFSVIKQTDDQVELSFSSDSGSKKLPFEFDRRFVMLRGVSGFYEYAIYERSEGSPDLDLFQTRIVFKLNPEKFVYMALSDKRRRFMPTPEDRRRGKPLAYPEAVLLTEASNPDLRGKVDDKYQYSAENKDINVHGWISVKPAVGFWVITPSHEFIGGGPLKQQLTSHVGPTTLAMFMSTHYAGTDVTTSFRNGEPWKKVFGPVFVYLNSNPKDPMLLWDDAKRQMIEEVGKWPYNFPMSKDFVPSNQRATLSGQLQVHGNKKPIGASNGYVGLVNPGSRCSWQRDTKNYQFWVQADGSGKFQIKNVLPGTYLLHAWVPGFLGDHVSYSNITLRSGVEVSLGKIILRPPRQGPTLWEIGIPDRTAAEFYIPDPDPKLTSGLYSKNNFDKFREYGLWDRYTELYPNDDLTFTVNVSDYRKDWFFAHVNRRKDNQLTFTPTTWRIFFTLSTVSVKANYRLLIALASANYAELQVRINDADINSKPHFKSGRIGRDNAIARHGIHGLYMDFQIDVPGTKLLKGRNIIYLTQPREGAFTGLMYDYIRFEGPAKEDGEPPETNYKMNPC